MSILRLASHKHNNDQHQVKTTGAFLQVSWVLLSGFYKTKADENKLDYRIQSILWGDRFKKHTHSHERSFLVGIHIPLLCILPLIWDHLSYKTISMSGIRLSLLKMVPMCKFNTSFSSAYLYQNENSYLYAKYGFCNFSSYIIIYTCIDH